MELTLQTDFPYSQMQQLFATELQRKHERTSASLREEDGKAVFTISAKDTTALRAAVNAITSILGVYEKTLEACNG